MHLMVGQGVGDCDHAIGNTQVQWYWFAANVEITPPLHPSGALLLLA
jgi:hypothetical protein